MNICYVGNSVSSQKLSYRDTLSNLISQNFRSEKFINCTLGGIGSLGISFFIDQFIGENKVDICFLETFVADLGGATPTKYLRQALNGIVQNPKLKNSKIIPIYLYRSDIELEQFNLIHQIYNDVFLNINISPLNIYSHVEKEVFCGHACANELLYDQVHTTPHGAEFYAHLIFSHFQQALQSQSDDSKFIRKNEGFVPALLGPIETYACDGKFSMGRFRLLLPYIQIAQNNSVVLTTDDFSCVGLVVIADSETGVVQINYEDWSQTAQIYDQWCENARIQVVIFKEIIPPHKKFLVAASNANSAGYGANLTPNNNTQLGQNIKIVRMMAFNLK
jgi:hypothetical protein